MGVPGLWKILNDASETQALLNLAVVEGFERNPSGKRTLRLGIDAGPWLEHASYSAGPGSQRKGAEPTRGKNAELRTLFFRLCRMSKWPVSIVFVFDGKRGVKRGSRMGKSGSHRWAKGFKELVYLFGWDWRESPGEAEAELAFLNASGYIDAVITDDVDALIFGAKVVIKNMSTTLTGNKSHPALDANGKPSAHHANVYRAETLATHPRVQLTRGGMILIALMSKSDYDPTGVPGVGTGVAHGLARCGFGDTLLNAYRERLAGNWAAFKAQWRADLLQELRTNSRGFLSSRHPGAELPHDWPQDKFVGLWADPRTSGDRGLDGGGGPRDKRAVDLAGIAQFCEDHFDAHELAHRSRMLYRFFNLNLLAQGCVMALLKAAAAEADRRETDRRIAEGARPADVVLHAPLQPRVGDGVGTGPGLVKKCLAVRIKPTKDDRMARIAHAFVRRDTPEPEEQDVEVVWGAADPNPVVVRITRARQHVSTDMLPEYRVEICPRQMVAIASSGIRGKHPEPHPLPDALARALGGGGDSDDELGRDDEEDGNKNSKDPNDNILMWIPASIMRQVHPEIVEEFEDGRRERQARKSPKKRTTAAHEQESAAGPSRAPVPAPAASGKGKGKGRARPNADEEYILYHNPWASSSAPRHDIDAMAMSTFPLPLNGFIFTWPDADNPDHLIVDTTDRDDLPTKVNYAEIDGLGVGVYGEYPAAAAAPVPRAPAASSSRSKGKEKATANARKDQPRVDLPAPRRGRTAANPPEDEDGPWNAPQARAATDLDHAIDQILGLPGTSRASRGKATSARARQPRASSSAGLAPTNARSQSARTSGAVGSSKGKGRAADEPRPAKRRRTTQRAMPGGNSEDDLPRSASQLRPSSASQPRPSTSASSLRSKARPGPSASASQPARSLPLFLPDHEDDLTLSRSPSPVPFWRQASPPAPLPPPSSSAAPTPTSSQSVPASNKRSIPDDDVIDLSDDESEPDRGRPRAGVVGDEDEDSDNDDDAWRSMPLFAGKESLYSQHKAARSAQSLLSQSRADSGSDGEDEDDDAMDQDGAGDAWGAASSASAHMQRGHKLAYGRPAGSGSSRQALARSANRDLPVPGSSQESTLDDGDGFFGDASIVIDLT